MVSVPHPPALKRDMSALGGFVIALTNLSPSLSVFVGGTVMLQLAGTFVLAGLALATLLSAVVAGLYAELGSAFPSAGGDYVLVGNTLGPAFRFAMLGFVVVSYSLAMAVAGLGIADFLHPAAPGLDPHAVAVASVVVATGLAALSIRTNARLTGALTVLEIAALAVLALLGAWRHQRGLADAVLHPVMAAPAGGLQPTGLLAMAAIGSAAIYTLNGYGAAVAFGEEVVDAPARMARMVFGALAVGAACIIAPLAGVVVGAPDLAALLASPTPLQDFVRDVGGADLAAALGLSVAAAIFNAMLVFALTGGRAVWAAAREGVFPPGIGRALGRVHPRHGSPWAATLAVGAASLPSCFVPIAALITVNGTGAAIGFGLLGAAVIAGRRSGKTAGARFRLPLHPLGPAVVIAFAAALVAGALAGPASGRIGVLFALAVMGAGALAYALVVRPAGRWRA